MRFGGKVTMTGQSDLEAAMRAQFAVLRTVYESTPFRAVLDELWNLAPGTMRRRFVRDVLLDEQARSARGIRLPAEVELQRTWFGDDRPTLFALVAHLPDGLTWKKVTFTVDDIDSMAPSAIVDEKNQPV